MQSSQWPLFMFSASFMNLGAQYCCIESRLKSEIEEVLSSAMFINEPTVAALWQQSAERAGAAHCVHGASGSDALVLALRALLR